MTSHRRLYRFAWLVLLPVLGAGCGGGASDQPSGPPPVNPSSQTARAWPQVPTERSDFPDGVYRTEWSVERLREVGIDDPGMAGTWTLTVADGTFTLECRPVATPGVDCGNRDPSMSPEVEVGTLHGTGETVWFVRDTERLMELTGCVRHSMGASGCGPEDPYRFDCTVDGQSMSCRNYVGLGDFATFPELSNWTGQPWTRIA